MNRPRLFAALAAGAMVVGIAGCGIGPSMQPQPGPPALAVPAYAFGELIGGQNVRVRKAVAAGAKRLSPQEVPALVNAQHIELRRQTAGTGVEVLRSGDLLLVRMPANVAFDSGRADIRPQGQSLLGEIAWTLKTYKRSLVDVYGHSDSTGSAASNQAISQKRAQAVAAYLTAHGVAKARIATRGFAAAYPIADNATEVGRELNRRVEVKVVPLR